MPYILGVGSTPFTKLPNQTFRELARRAIQSALDDAGHITASIESIHFGNCAMQAWGQNNIRGQTVLSPLLTGGTLPQRTPITNVEGGCATGSLAFIGALREVQSGCSDVAMAIGVEKLVFPNDPKMIQSFPLFAGGIDQRHRSEWLEYFRTQSERFGVPFQPHPHRVIFLDIHAMQAQFSIDRGWVTSRQLACVAAKNHNNAVNNPLAQYQFSMTTDQILSDRQIVSPLTRSMCAPVSDGAAAVVLCSDSFYTSLPAQQRNKAVRIKSSALAGGRFRNLDEATVVSAAAAKAYRRAGISPQDIDFAEVHDSTAHCELKHIEALGLCPEHLGGQWTEEGRTLRDGQIPVNPSGGLISKGHPLGATGLGQVYEVTKQLRGEAGDHQLPTAVRRGIIQNGGGVIGLDEALCAVTILEAV